MNPRKLNIVAGLAAALFFPTMASAVPALQLYMPNGTYNSTNETWEVASEGFELWVVGDTSWKGTIVDVKLLAHYFDYDGDTTGNNISISPLLENGAHGAEMTALHGGENTIKYSENGVEIEYLAKPTLPGTTPVYEALPSPSLANNGEAKMSEGVAADSYEVYYLGDFNRKNDPISTYDAGYDPTAVPEGSGHVEKFWVEMSGWDAVHFDGFDHVISNNKTWYLKTPYSKNATGNGEGYVPPGVVPEPGTYLLFGTGLLGLSLGVRRKKGRWN